MLMLFAALASQPQPVWWDAFKRERDRCGLVFNVDSPGPSGDGVLVDKDNGRLILSRKKGRPRKPIACVAAWAKRNGIKVRYENF